MTNPLHLTQVSLRRFKATYDLPNVPLGMFNVIIGRNGVGKSTLLEALQWIDTAVRQTTDVACDRYNGIGDLINHHDTGAIRSFALETRLSAPSGALVRYSCCVEERARQAKVASENLYLSGPGESQEKHVLWTEDDITVEGRAW